MGKILNGILGGVSGKVAGVVGGSWKGTNYLRGYAIPANPQTAPQVSQRNKLTFLVLVAKSILTNVIQEYWDAFYSHMSGYNGFMQTNLKLVTAPDDYELIQLTKGGLEAEAVDAAEYTSGSGEVVVTWSPTGLGNGEDTDSVRAVIIDADNDVAFVSDADQRSNVAIVFNVGSGRTLASLHCYLFFYRGTGEDFMVSNSDYSVVTAP